MLWPLPRAPRAHLSATCHNKRRNAHHHKRAMASPRYSTRARVRDCAPTNNTHPTTQRRRRRRRRRARHRRFPSPRERRRERTRERKRRTRGFLDGGIAPKGAQTHSRRPTSAHKQGRRQKNPDSETPETQSPSTHRRPDKTQTKTGDRSPDQTRPTARPRDRQTHPERTYLAVGRLGGPLELAGASQFGPCVGLEGGRDGSRPSRPPHGHAGCSRRGRTRLRGRERPPAQLQGVARSCNLRDIGGFASILSCFFHFTETQLEARRAPPVNFGRFSRILSNIQKNKEDSGTQRRK